jgi:hypothetical protein
MKIAVARRFHGGGYEFTGRRNLASKITSDTRAELSLFSTVEFEEIETAVSVLIGGVKNGFPVWRP